MKKSNLLIASYLFYAAWVNQHLQIVPHAPFGGAKWSGIGVENGPWGLYGFTEARTINIAKK